MHVLFKNIEKKIPSVVSEEDQCGKGEKAKDGEEEEDHCVAP